MKNNTYSARSTLLSLGVSEIKATFALQQIQLSPVDSDPDAGATVILIKAVQRGMNQIGCPVRETGRLDASTAACIRRASGPDWEHKSWLEITKDIVLLRHSGYQLTGPMPTGLGAVSGFSQMTGLALIAGIAYLAFKYKK
jgi:hypothetical protein